MTGVRDLGKLVEFRDGHPAMLRWLTIHADGRVVVQSSRNSIAWSTEDDLPPQWCLVRDVFGEVDPPARGSSLAALLRIDVVLGVVFVPPSSDGPLNTVVTTMLGELGIDREVHRTAAWLASVNPLTGLHGDLDEQQQIALMTLAERSGGVVGGGAP